MEIVIREATLADEGGLELLYAEIDTLHREALPQLFRRHEETARPSTFLLDRLTDETMGLFVAEVNGRLVGMILLKIRSEEHPVKYTQQYLHISTLIVAADFQGKGVAQLLMDTAVTFARAHNLAQLRLNVYDFNQRAIAFYEKEGFTTLTRHMWKEF